MRPGPWKRPGVLNALGAVLGSAALLALAVGRAATLETIDPAAATVRPGLPVRATGDSLDPDRADFMVAVANDPFLPERTAKPTRYRPGGPQLEADALTTAPVAQELVVLGVAVLPDGGGVAASRYGGESRLVRIGQQIGPFRLLRVEAGRAVFEGPNGVPRTLMVRKPES